jgi:hypothetical protein
MILPANDPNASRSGWRTSAGEGKAAATAPRRGHHAWPFLSPQGRRPAQQDGPKVPRNDSGS